MNLRIRKKKYDQYRKEKIAHITIPFEYVAFIFTAARAKGINDTFGNAAFQKFVNSTNVKKAVKSKLRRTIWMKYKCDNIDDMYRYMIDEIKTDRKYQEDLKRIKEIIKPFTDEEVRDAGEAWEHKERVLMMFSDDIN